MGEHIHDAEALAGGRLLALFNRLNATRRALGARLVWFELR
jgi:hypothetical protein